MGNGTRSNPVTDDVIERVSTLIEQVANDEIVPRFRRLVGDSIRTKEGGEVVTDADLAAEKALAVGLRQIIPRSLVVGEEAASADPTLVRSLGQADDVWLIDPVDGTTHFARGEEPFGVMVALVRDGQTIAGWIHLPISGVMATAVRGLGARLNGRVAQPSFRGGTPRGALLTRFFPSPLKGQIERAGQGLDLVESQWCAAARYVRLLEGAEQFALYFRTHPWDHAAGVLLVQEAGGIARRLDRSPYSAGDEKDGLLVATNEPLWNNLQIRLSPKA